jgi:hypothetical protein
MPLIEGGSILERRKKFLKGFIFYGHDFPYYTHPENDTFAFRYPRHDKIVHTMTFSADHSQDSFYYSHDWMTRLD